MPSGYGPVFLLALVILPGVRASGQSGAGRDTTALPAGTGTGTDREAEAGVVGDGPAALEEQIDGVGEGGELELLPEEEKASPGAGPIRVRSRTRFAGKIQEGRGYGDGRYAGDRLKSMQRLLISGGEWLAAGLLIEKDPGERNFADHLSGSVALWGKEGSPGIVAGDFRIRSGRGLVFSGGRTFGKGSDVITPAGRSGWGIQSTPTSDESRFFRGVAIRGSAGPLSLAAFLSSKKTSASLSGEGMIESLDETGYHRTATELRNRDRVVRKSSGFLAGFDGGGALSIGVNVLEETYAPGGTRERRISVDLLLRGPVTVFGEAAAFGSRVFGVAGASYGDKSRGRILVAGRFYPSDQGLSSLPAFGDRPGGVNERGIYAGLELHPAPAVLLYAYLDVFTSPDPSRDALFPRSGIDRLAGVSLWKGSRFSVEGRFRSREVERKETIPAPPGLSLPTNGRTAGEKWRLEIRWRPGPRLGTAARVEFSTVRPAAGADEVVPGGAERGIMLFADLIAGTDRGLSVRFRAIFFDTDSYAARLVEVEPDLPGSLTGGVLSGRGTRWYLLPAWNFPGGWRLSAKFSRSVFDGRRSLGSGPEEFPGNIEERAGVQLDVEF